LRRCGWTKGASGRAGRARRYDGPRRSREALRRTRSSLRVPSARPRFAERDGDPELGPYATDHLVRKARSGKYSLGYLQREEDAFKRLLEFFSPKRRVASITDADISRY